MVWRYGGQVSFHCANPLDSFRQNRFYGGSTDDEQQATDDGRQREDSSYAVSQTRANKQEMLNEMQLVQT